MLQVFFAVYRRAVTQLDIVHGHNASEHTLTSMDIDDGSSALYFKLEYEKQSVVELVLGCIGVKVSINCFFTSSCRCEFKVGVVQRKINDLLAEREI